LDLSSHLFWRHLDTGKYLVLVGAKSIARSNDFSYIGPTSIIQKETGGVQPNKEFLTFFNMAGD
jgi:hypothetical protein